MPAEQTVAMLDTLARIITMDVIHAIPTAIIYGLAAYITLRLVDR